MQNECDDVRILGHFLLGTLIDVEAVNRKISRMRQSSNGSNVLGRSEKQWIIKRTVSFTYVH